MIHIITRDGKLRTNKCMGKTDNEPNQEKSYQNASMIWETEDQWLEEWYDETAVEIGGDKHKKYENKICAEKEETGTSEGQEDNGNSDDIENNRTQDVSSDDEKHFLWTEKKHDCWNDNQKQKVTQLTQQLGKT